MPTSAQLIPITYYPNSADWFTRLRKFTMPIWLDSGHPKSTYGRFDILSAAPALTLTTLGELTVVNNWHSSHTSTANPFVLLQDCLAEPQAALEEVPFCGGALGYFGYDLGRRLEKLPDLAVRDIALPDMSIGIYPWAIVQDHQLTKAWLVKNPALSPGYNFLEIETICQANGQTDGFHDLKINLGNHKNLFRINKFISNLNPDSYSAAIEKIQAYVQAGDCYQVNFAQRFTGDFEGDTFSAYLRLREVLPSPFSAYVELAGGALLSLSPERFIKLDQQLVETSPIKGTIARGATPSEDLANAEILKSSLKDRAENLMIVDLLRNDLSRTCTDVRVPELFSLQSFANVHHLVSKVTGKLKPNKSALDLLSTSFPGGSVTGAPKIRAMEIIEELEPVRRSVYCGSLGYISACGNMDTNIAIRTLVCDGSKIHCWGGGGIVADSETNQEYQESFAKVKVLLDTLEQHFKNS